MPDKLDIPTDSFERLYLSPQNFSTISRLSSSYNRNHSVQIVQADGTISPYPLASSASPPKHYACRGAECTSYACVNDEYTSYAYLNEEYFPAGAVPSVPQRSSSRRPIGSAASTTTSYRSALMTPMNSRNSQDSLRSSRSSVYSASSVYSRSSSSSFSSSSSTGLPWSPHPEIETAPATPVMPGSPSFSVASLPLPRSPAIESSPYTCLEGAHHPLCGGKCESVGGFRTKALRARQSLRRMRSMIDGLGTS